MAKWETVFQRKAIGSWFQYPYVNKPSPFLSCLGKYGFI